MIPPANPVLTADGEAIVRLPRRKTVRRPLPPEGAYIGSGVSAPHGGLFVTGLAFTCWSPERPALDEIVRLCKADNQGNTLQFWQSGGKLVELAPGEFRLADAPILQPHEMLNADA